MTNFILKNIITGVKENLSYSELMTRLNKNRKDFFNTYRIETVSKKPIIEKLYYWRYFLAFFLWRWAQYYLRRLHKFFNLLN